MKVIGFDKLVEIHAQTFKRNHEMLPEEHITLYSNDVILVMFVVEIQVLQNSQLDTCLILELLFIADDFECNRLLCLMIKTLDSLTKAAHAQEFLHFVPVSQVVFKDNLVVALIVIKTMVEDAHLLQSVFCPLHLLDWTIFYQVSFNLLLAILAKIVNFVAETLNFLLLEFSEELAKVFDSIARSHREIWSDR